ncbi:hypothetical protein [Gryllotalpicola protaetiae]|uniref:Uncharacterized protein n=1 Tax=Gryllotalpicola protaetiae TaxID=2419771 RepID=A0A387BMA4_9MICO|nr:hypothetical protein [Gryllotalpicola protaetiae]AYG02150.1 hypothetical protein D7I44_00465 [Gryllotalpicola protaetiae]
MTSGAVSGLGWLLLEHVVHADAWVHTTISSPADPVTALLVFALLCAFAVAIARASRRVIRARIVACAQAAHRPAMRARARRRAAISVRVPSGARGPRAPAVVLVG